MKIAIAGGGISGLYAAYLLHKDHEVTVFEAGSYPGGHTNTVDVELDGDSFAVDTGFIVHNDRNYPLFVDLINTLGVEAQDGEMSFSMRCALSGLEYSGSNLNTLFAQRRNLLRPSFYSMLREILRFNALAADLISAPADENLAGFLRRHHFSGAMVDDYLVPMAAAIWSSNPAEIMDFPAAYFGHFFDNHGLLSIKNRPQWRTICGGSRQYVGPLISGFRDRVLVNTPVERVERSADSITVKARGLEAQQFDQIIFACHSNQALNCLADATAQEREILGAIPYQRNETLLHTDASLLPKRKRAWAAWNYHRFAADTREVSVTYHMSLLQRLESPRPLLVSLNAADKIDPNSVLQRIDYEHPVYNASSVAARARWHEISGLNRSHFCGAYWGYGFHEDGLRSALTAVEALTQGYQQTLQ